MKTKLTILSMMLLFAISSVQAEKNVIIKGEGNFFP